MKGLNRLGSLLALLLVVGCGSKRSAVKAYGAEEFAVEVLEFLESGELSKGVQEEFEPIAVTSYLTGVLLVFSDTGNYREGIYVDRGTLEGWGGSGLEITEWHENIGWARIKKRKALD